MAYQDLFAFCNKKIMNRSPDQLQYRFFLLFSHVSLMACDCFSLFPRECFRGSKVTRRMKPWIFYTDKVLIRTMAYPRYVGGSININIVLLNCRDLWVHRDAFCLIPKVGKKGITGLARILVCSICKWKESSAGNVFFRPRYDNLTLQPSLPH